MADLTFNPTKVVVVSTDYLDPLNFEIQILKDGAPVNNQDVAVSVDCGGKVQATSTEGTGKTTVTWYDLPNITSFTGGKLTVTVGQDSGTLDLQLIILAGFGFDAAPLVLEEAGDITFTLRGQEFGNAGLPANVKIAWTSTDLTNFPVDFSPLSGNPAASTYTQKTKTMSAPYIEQNRGSTITATVTIQDPDGGQVQPGIPQKSITAQLGYLLPPIYVPGADTGDTTIDDDTIAIYADQGGIPWGIKPVLGLAATGTLTAKLYASPTELMSLSDLQSNRDVLFLGAGRLHNEAYTEIGTPVTDAAYQQAYAELFVHYTITDSTYSPEAEGISRGTKITVELENPTPLIDRTLIPLELSQYQYTMEDLAEQKVMVSTFYFPQKRTLKAGDIITVKMDLTGIDDDNLGQPGSKELAPYTLKAEDISSKLPLIFPGDKTGSDNGFDSTRLADVKGSTGQVYYTVNSGGNITTAASRSVTISTVPPHSGVEDPGS
ncbi:hypothetical protein [Bordetella sp. N]|uniref:hypothetical protein n=1 Tax=Bordetella sp. N TaxID=1746199 RepID=UPI0007095A5C|nr:hypothetical protein [Bordetella sp. N]ALM84694.1 hypothetical protein ASB57_18450 [Bordetella sp. N]